MKIRLDVKVMGAIKNGHGDIEVTVDEARKLYRQLKELFDPPVEAPKPTTPVIMVYGVALAEPTEWEQVKTVCGQVTAAKIAEYYANKERDDGR